jgi:subtilisin family serine protease
MNTGVCRFQEQPVHSLQLANVTQTLKDAQPWGIDLVDGVRDGTFSYTWTGRGVNVYIFDTGIQLNHAEFTTGRTTSRASCGFNVFDTDGVPDKVPCLDEKGHGTHIAGTVGGVTYGLAKEANLIAVKVLDQNGDGTTTGVIAGLNYVAEQKLRNPDTPMIVNLSLGSGVSQSMNEAIDRVSAMGVVVVGASGNESVDACTTSPASAATCITVGAMNSLLRRPTWSNYGNCVDLHAYVLEFVRRTRARNDRMRTTHIHYILVILLALAAPGPKSCRPFPTPNLQRKPLLDPAHPWRYRTWWE